MKILNISKMGQDDIYNYLKENGESSINDIRKGLNCSNCYVPLNKLMNRGDVKVTRVHKKDNYHNYMINIYDIVRKNDS